MQENTNIDQEENFQMELAICCDCMQQDDAVGQTHVAIRKDGRLEFQEIDSGDIDLNNLNQYEVILFDGGNTHGDRWKHTFFPALQQEFFVKEF